MIRRALLVLLAAMILAGNPVRACTIFMAERDGLVLAGNNEDYFLDAEAKMWATPGEKGDHGRITFGFRQKRIAVFAQGGVNDKGLFFDAAVTPMGVEPRDKDKPNPPKDMGDHMLAECATVEEAISWLGRYRLTLLKGSHFLLADATGDSAVIELIDGELKVIRKEPGKHALGVTNFSVTRPELGNFPCPRFAKMRDAVKAGPVTVDNFRAILQSVAVPRTYSDKDKRYGGTLYSNVYDLTNGVVYVYSRDNFEKVLTVNVAQYLEKGKKTYRLDELLPATA